MLRNCGLIISFLCFILLAIVVFSCFGVMPFKTPTGFTIIISTVSGFFDTYAIKIGIFIALYTRYMLFVEIIDELKVGK